MRIKLNAVWFLCLLLIASTLAFGQATASSAIAGSVLDKTGAAIVGADVTISSSATGFSRTVKTTDQGNYRVDPLPAGVYKVTASMAGFGASVADRVETLVGSTATQNFSLSAGSTKETVEVSTESPLVDQEKTDVGQNITPKEVEELPLLGRDAANLAYLAPGVKAADSYDPTKSRYAILSVNGSSGRNLNTTVNGIDNKDSTVGGAVMQLPLEAVQEFVISTQRFSAANGRSEGAAINMITKSGSNNYHGSVFGFFRDQAFNANDKLSEEGGSDKPPYSRQQYGGSIGGPIKKDKFFGFFAYEKQREHTNLPEDPTAFAELQLATSLGAVPASVIPTPFFESRYNGRLDYHFTDRESAYFSYSAQGNNGLNDQSNGQGDLTEGNFTTNQLQLANLTLNSALSNTLVNTASLGFQYWNNVIDSNQRLPFITFPGGASFGTNVNVPQQSYQRKYQFKDDLTKIVGNHTFKMGADYLYNPTLGGFFASNITTEFDFNQDPSAIVLLPNKFATPGLINSISASNGDPATNVPGGTKSFGAYFEDDWKVSHRLTLNLGLRYDHDYNTFGESAIPHSQDYFIFKAIGSPLVDKLPHEDNLDFSPRIGVAYDVTGSGKHILRAGYGLYYGQTFQNIPLFAEQHANATVYQGVFSITQDSGGIVPGTGIPLTEYRYGVDPLPTIAPPSSRLADGSTGRLIDPNYRNPYSEQANIGYQWQLTTNSVFEAEYVHELGLHENKTVNGNPVINGVRPLSAAFAAAGQPILGRLGLETAQGRSRYDGMNLSFRRRLSNRFSVNANYTLSHSVAYEGSAASFRNNQTNPLFPLSPLDFGPTPNDELHHVTLDGIAQLPFGIQISPILQFGSARPYNLTEGYDVYGFGSGITQPLIVENSDPKNYTVFGSSSLRSAARSCLAAGQCHQLQFDPVRGDYFFQLDSRIAKNIKLGESRNLQLIFQAFNLTNHTNFGNNFNGTATSKNFGTPAGYINPTAAYLPRAFVGEFGARFSF